MCTLELAHLKKKQPFYSNGLTIALPTPTDEHAEVGGCCIMGAQADL